MYIKEFYSLVVSKVIENIREITIISYKKIFKIWHHFKVKVRGIVKVEPLLKVKFFKTIIYKYTNQT